MFGMKRDVVVRLVQRDRSPCLVASFRNSVQPVTWQIALTGSGRLSLSLRADEGAWVVSLRKEGRPTATEVQFLGRSDAEAAYEALRRGLFQADLVRGVGTTLGVLAIVGLLFVGVSLLFVPKETKTAPVPAKESALEDLEKGRPAVADDVLSKMVVD